MLGADGRQNDVAAFVLGIVAVPVDAQLHGHGQAADFTQTVDGAGRAGTVGSVVGPDTAGGFQDAPDQGPAAVGIGVLAAVAAIAAAEADARVDAAASMGPVLDHRLGVEVECLASLALRQPPFRACPAGTDRQIDLGQRVGRDEREGRVLRVGCVEVDIGHGFRLRYSAWWGLPRAVRNSGGRPSCLRAGRGSSPSGGPDGPARRGPGGRTGPWRGSRTH